ncbi:MAG TPA: transglutaminase-like domain-containing protein [Anaerolineales bacterium]|jgi:regulator of sirC expression with transglutaminase-like and TPR domain|nr:transglutaminase-like domain-containing protein [Anaerolineales bacterium]
MTELTFRDEINRNPINIPRAALCFAKEIAYPGLEVGQYLAQLEQLASTARREIPPEASIRERAELLADLLFQEIGFRGNIDAYEDPRNSYLNEVLDQQLGIPISLAVIYVAIAEKLDLPARGVGLPGHFIVSVQDPKGEWYLDPFNGGIRLSVGDCARLVQDTTGFEGAFDMDWLKPSGARSTLARMLNNLKIIYVQQEAWSYAVAVIEHLQMLQPDLPDHLRDLGLIHRQGGSLRQAIYYLERYLLKAGDAEDVEVVRKRLRMAIQELARRN